MTLSKTLPLLACLCFATTACNADDAASATAASGTEATTTEIPAEAVQATPATDSVDLVASVDESHRSTIGLAGVMTAMVEACGLGTAAQSREALANVQREMAAQGLSAAQVEAVFNAAYEEGKANAAQVDAAEKERSCQGLRQMADPAMLKQIERAGAEAEAALKQMQP